MAEIGKPKNKGTKGAPDTKKTTNNLTKRDTAAMNFVVDPDFRREYRTFASENDMSMVDILKESFRMYKNSKE
jgi:hypothetical protein